MVKHVFEYIMLLGVVAAIVSLTAFIVERKRNNELARRVRVLELKVANLKKQLEYMQLEGTSPHTIFHETTNTNSQDNLDHRILELYAKGYSYNKIAKMLGVSKSTVYRRLRKLLKEGKKAASKPLAVTA